MAEDGDGPYTCEKPARLVAFDGDGITWKRFGWGGGKVKRREV